MDSMSDIGIPAKILWAIQTDPQDATDLLALLVDDANLGVLLFTQAKFAESFFDE